MSEADKLETSTAEPNHRRVVARPGVTFGSLFEGYEGPRYDSSSAWPTDNLEGTAEVIAWIDDATPTDALL